LECYQACLARAFNKKVQPLSFQVDDQVWALRRPIVTTHKTWGKFTSKWEQPYVIYEIYTNGAYKIVDGEGFQLGLINGKFLKRYFLGRQMLEFAFEYKPKLFILKNKK